MKGSLKSLSDDVRVAVRFFGLAHKVRPTYIPLAIMGCTVKAFAPFLNIIMPKFIIDELMGARRVDVFVLLIAMVVIGNGVLSLLGKFFDTKLDIAGMALRSGLQLYLGEHIMNLDFEQLEDPQVLNQKEEALFAVNNQGAIFEMIHCSLSLIQTTVTLIGTAFIISLLNPLVLLLIVVVLLFNTLIYAKSQEISFKFGKQLIPINRKFGYYAPLAIDYSIAKEMRIYNMTDFLMEKIIEFKDQSLDTFNHLFSLNGKYQGITNVNLQLQMIVVYAYMTWRVFAKAIGIGDFTMYIAAANSFSSCISDFLRTFVFFRRSCKYLDLYVKFHDIPRRMTSGSDKPNISSDVRVEFKNVWFKYPRAEEYTIKDLSITINAGERLSVVGENGAGKTTFIKLLCRLYEPERGEILLNGKNIREFDHAEYMRLLSVVFQDYKLFSFTVKENLTLDSDYDEAAANLALERAGILEKVEGLSNGINTSLYKNFDEKGTEMSGGEMQKLAIARAIYKNAAIVILDEPTAALDPYAEFEIYSHFNHLIQNKTAVYISHRLSSCKFCDKIAVFHNGELEEYGTHAELSTAGGKYSQMWSAQAQYYV